jgi:NADP-dependent aldehyde dehydrogenase
LQICGQQIIASTFSRGEEPGFQAVNPVDGAMLVPFFSEATTENIDRAVASAEASFDDYRCLSLEQRASFLELIGDELLRLEKLLLARAHAETALPQQRLEGELDRTVNQIKLIAGLVRQGAFVDSRIDHALPQRKPLPRPDLRTMNMPLGPVVVFGASNFPLAFSVAGGDTVSALAAGCPVIVKGHPAHPGTSELAGQAIMAAVEKSKVPAGVFSLLQSEGHTAGSVLVQHPLIRAVAFTGSLAGGRAIFDLACARPEPVPVFAEMGSVNPVFLLGTSDREQEERLAEGLAVSITLGAGQFCTAPGLIFLLKDDTSEAFLTQLTKLLAKVSCGTMLHAGIKKNFQKNVARLQATAGVTLLGGASPSLAGCSVTAVLFKVDFGAFINTPALTDEVFGPAALVVICDSMDDLLVAAECLPGQLTASVHGAKCDAAENSRLLRILERKAGRLILNGFPTGGEVCSSMQHGGPYPASTDSRSTSVGPDAVKRFLRPLCYQNFSQELLPDLLRGKGSK